MVTASIIKRLINSQKGISFTEGLVVFPLVLLTFSAFIEFGYAMYQWNQSVKATQLGARLAIVSDPIAADMATILVADYPPDEGGPTPSAAVSAVCDGATLTGCDAGELDRLVNRMQEFNNNISSENILITYYRSGLGYVGRPGGPVVTITLQVSDVPLDLTIMNALLGFDFDVPLSKVTLTSEDLSSNKL